MLTTTTTTITTAVPKVTDHGYLYLVDLGRGPRHYVTKDKRCSCPQGASCPAVAAVADHLRNGGRRAPQPPSGYCVVRPDACPVCGAKTHHAPHLGNRLRGEGWVCEYGGERHYYKWRTNELAALPPRQWLYKPMTNPITGELVPGVRL